MHILGLELHSSTLTTRFAELSGLIKRRKRKLTWSSFESSSSERLHVTEKKAVRLIFGGFCTRR